MSIEYMYALCSARVQVNNDKKQTKSVAFCLSVMILFCFEHLVGLIEKRAKEFYYIQNWYFFSCSTELKLLLCNLITQNILREFLFILFMYVNSFAWWQSMHLHSSHKFLDSFFIYFILSLSFHLIRVYTRTNVCISHSRHAIFSVNAFDFI